MKMLVMVDDIGGDWWWIDAGWIYDSGGDAYYNIIIKMMINWSDMMMHAGNGDINDDDY